MLVVFQSILPIFLLVLLGVALKRAPVINADFWVGLEQCSYWVLFPALLFVTMVKADFSNTEDLAVSSAAIISVVVMSGGLLVAWPLFHKLRVGSPAFTSLFQTATRWNAFMALAIAAKTFGQQGLTTVGLVMAAITIPLNLINVTVLLWFSGRGRNYRVLVYRIVTNPLILSTALGILVNIVDIPIYEPVMTAVELLSQASLSLGLITVGAGLRIMDALKPQPITLLAVFLKLIFFPLVAVGVGLLTGIEGNGLVLLALSASVPTAMNGYLLAKQLNGDADLYAAAATLQVAGSFFSIPVIMTLVAYAAAG
ncbi:AEC family transporter [Neorhizobium sp. Rsf11]|uniref:AEC family transporter n=2 Tax=Neorhizobium TaxID=1525371 RepID=A0ABV0M417_9HYPH|nr:AEC family transporter [Neorhizobium petrolearium]MCC2609553.1 AEC family transporter [Neorhizobium petrolearium]WGI69757.1 AEC family transporter [Neorhizobium petrolearium]